MFQSRQRFGVNLQAFNMFFRVNVFFIAFWCLCVSSHAQNAASTFHKTLENGLTVLVLEDRSMPVVTVSWVTRENVAVLGDTAGGLGLLNALMFNTANESAPSAALVEERMRTSGIRYNMHRGDIYTVHNYNALQNKFDTLLNIIKANVTTPLLLDVEIKAAKQKADSLHRNYKTGPGWLVTENRIRVQRLNGNFAFDPMGRHQSLQAATREQLLEYRDAMLNPANALLIVQGNVNRFDVFNKAQQYFGGWSVYGSRQLTSTPTNPLSHSTQSVVSTPLAPLPTLDFFFNGPSQFTAYNVATALVSQQLLNGPRSALSKSLLSGDVAVDISNDLMYSGSALLLRFTFAVPPDKFESGYPTIYTLIDSFANNSGVTDATLKSAKRDALQKLQSQSADRNSQHDALAWWWSLGLVEAAGTLSTSINNVTPDDVKIFLQQFIDNKPSIRLLVVSPAVQSAYKIDRSFTSFEDVSRVGVAFEKNSETISGDANALNALVQFVRINDPRYLELMVNQDASEREGLVKKRYVTLYKRLVEAGLTEAQMDALRAGLYVRRGRTAEQQRQNQFTNLRYSRE